MQSPSLSLSLSLSHLVFSAKTDKQTRWRSALALAARSQHQCAAHQSRGELRSACGAHSAAASYKPPMLVTPVRLPACAMRSAALFRSPTSGARFTYHCSAALPAGMQRGSPLCQTRAAKAPKTRRDAAREARHDSIDVLTTVWPNGVERWLKAPFRKDVGSNPTPVTFLCQASTLSAHLL